MLCIHSGSDHPDLKELYRYVKGPIAARWFGVGVELFEEDDIKQLNTIKSSNNGNAEECCAEMLKLWHEKYPKTTWNDLIESLNAPGIELRDTASRIEEMLLPTGMFANSNCHIFETITSTTTTATLCFI